MDKKYGYVLRWKAPEYVTVENLYDGDNTFTLTKQGTGGNAELLQYSLDGTAWTSFSLTATDTVTIPSGGGKDDSNYWKMSTSQNAKLYGNMATLLKYLDPDSVTAVPDYGFSYLFSDWSKLTDASGLNFGNITTVGSSGLYRAFYRCSSLTTAPDFSSVTSVGSYGFSSAFNSCSSLTTAPDFGSVTSVGSTGFSYALKGCTSLNYAIAPSVSRWDTTNFSGWLENVAATGVVNKPAALTIPTGTNGIPSGWTTTDR